MKRSISRNEPCPCGSGRKYKHCCLKKRLEWLIDEDGKLHRSVPIDDPELSRVLDKAMAEFRDKHGRDLAPDELIFQDLGHFEYIEAQMVDIIKRAGIEPAIIYAFEKTGRIVTEQNKNKIPDVELREWCEAVEEYHRRVEQGNEPEI